MAAPSAERSNRRQAVQGGLNSVSAALDLLDCFRDATTLGVTDLARRLGVGKSSAHRLLTSLCDRGYAVRDPATGRYQLGLHLYELGQLAVTRVQVRQRAMPILEALRQRTGFTIHLAVPQAADVIYVERLHALGRFPQMADVTYCLPAHLTSSGKAIAAFNPLVAAARRNAGFPVWTTASVRDAASWDAALDEVRRRGFAVSEGEVIPGVTSVAAPVRDRTGRADAAVSVVATTEELRNRIDSTGRLVMAAATQISGALDI